MGLHTMEQLSKLLGLLQTVDSVWLFRLKLFSAFRILFHCLLYPVFKKVIGACSISGEE